MFREIGFPKMRRFRCSGGNSVAPGVSPHTLPDPMHFSEIKDRLDVAIITIRQDEYDAVEARLEKTVSVEGGRYGYEYADIPSESGGNVSVVLTRCVAQGNSAACSVATLVIQDLNPSWLFLVGIAGGIPDAEYSLGDVAFSTALHDFSFGAAGADGQRSYQAGGGPMHPDVEKFLSTGIVGGNGRRVLEIADADGELSQSHPPVIVDRKNITVSRSDSPGSHRKVFDCLAMRFPGGRRKGGPLIWAGPCVNGNLVVKDPELLQEWQKYARQATHVETELAGVWNAARTAGSQNYRVLAIRGLSDIVGFKRDPQWTQYACHTAAAVAVAVLKCGRLELPLRPTEFVSRTSPRLDVSPMPGTGSVLRTSPPPSVSRYDIFISYRSDDFEGALVRGHFKTYLEKVLIRKFAEWPNGAPKIFIAEHTLGNGESWETAVAQALRNSRLMLSMFSVPYFTRPWCVAEYNHFVDRNKALGRGGPFGLPSVLQPVLLSPREDLPPTARSFQTKHDLSDFVRPSFFKGTRLIKRFEQTVEAIAVDIIAALKSVGEIHGDWDVAPPEPQLNSPPRSSFPGL